MKKALIGISCLLWILTTGCKIGYVKKTDGEQQVVVSMTIEEIRELYQLAHMRDITRPDSYVTDEGVKIIINRD